MANIRGPTSANFKVKVKIAPSQWRMPSLEKEKIIKISFEPAYLGFQEGEDHVKVLAAIARAGHLIPGLAKAICYRTPKSGSILYAKVKDRLPDSFVDNFHKPIYLGKRGKNNDIHLYMHVNAMTNPRTKVTLEGIPPSMPTTVLVAALKQAIPPLPNGKVPNPIFPSYLRADQALMHLPCVSDEIPHFVEVEHEEEGVVDMVTSVLTLKIAGRRLVCFDCGSKHHRAGADVCPGPPEDEPQEEDDSSSSDSSSSYETDGGVDEDGFETVTHRRP